MESKLNGEIASDVSNGVVCRKILKISEGTLPPEVYDTLRAKDIKDDNVTVVWCVGAGTENCNMDPASAEAHHADCKRKRKVAMVSCLVLLLIGTVHTVQAVVAYKMVSNINAGAFWATNVLLFGGLISLLGVYNKKEGLRWMSHGLTLILVGIVLALIGAIIDGVAASAVSEIDFSKCSYTDTGKPDCDNVGLRCNATLSHINSCYCCYVAMSQTADCGFKSVGLAQMPSHFGGVNSCRQVIFTYCNLLWGSVAFSALAAIIAIIVGALVSGYKTMISTAAVVYTTSASGSPSITTTYAFPRTGTLPPPRPPPPNLHRNSMVYAPVVAPQLEPSMKVAPTTSYPVQQTYAAMPPRPTAPPRPTSPPSHLSTQPPAYHT